MRAVRAGDNLGELAEVVYDRLIAVLGTPERRVSRLPVDELILTILSQNTTDVNSLAAFERLKDRFEGWDRLISVEYSEVLDAIRVAGLGPTKARRILELMPLLKRVDPTLTLSFLCSMRLEEGYAFLTGLRGVGRKTAACVLLFSCGKPAFPVDTHVFRVAKRIGLDSGTRTRDEMQSFFEQTVPEEQRYNLHVNLIRHGRKTCAARSPKCEACFLTDLCDYYKRVRDRHSPEDST